MFNNYLGDERGEAKVNLFQQARLLWLHQNNRTF